MMIARVVCIGRRRGSEKQKAVTTAGTRLDARPRSRVRRAEKAVSLCCGAGLQALVVCLPAPLQPAADGGIVSARIATIERRQLRLIDAVGARRVARRWTRLFRGLKLRV